MSRFDNEILAAIGQILERIEDTLERIDRRLRILESQIFNITQHPDSLDIIFYGDKGEIMADLVLAQGESKTAVLHYLTKGVDSGAVPVGDSPVFTSDDPAGLSITPNPDGSVVVANTNTGNSDVNVNLTGAVASKGLTVTKVVTCTGITVTPPAQPDAVDIVFQ